MRVVERVIVLRLGSDVGMRYRSRMRSSALACLLLLGTACRGRSPAPSMEAGSEASARSAEGGVPLDPASPLALCKESYPCPPSVPGGDTVPSMCALDGKREIDPGYSAPGLTLHRTWCPFSKMGMPDVVGVPPDPAGPHLRGAELYARVRGSKEERALAAAELLVDPGFFESPPLVTSPACPIVEDGQGVHFCSKTLTMPVAHCVVEPSGALACSEDGTPNTLRACRLVLGQGRISAEELSMKVNGSDARATSALPSNLVGGLTGAPGVTLRAKGLRVRVASCRTDAKGEKKTYWGEDTRGKFVPPLELFPKLDDVVMRAALARDLVSEDGSEHGWLLVLDPTGKPSGPGCVLPRGPREADGFVEFTLAKSRTTVSGLEHCRVSSRTLQGACEVVAHGSYCD